VLCGKTAPRRASWPPASVNAFQAIDVSAVTGSAAADSATFTAGQFHSQKGLGVSGTKLVFEISVRDLVLPRD